MLPVPSDPIVIIANFGELFHPFSEPSVVPNTAVPVWGEWKAALWPESGHTGRVLLVTDQAHVAFSPSLAWCRHPDQTIVVRTGVGRCAVGLLAQEEAQSQLFVFLKAERRVRIWATVWSDAVLEVVHRIRQRYPDLEILDVPSASPGRIRYWNSKRGGKELLESVGEVKKLLPKSTVCHGSEQVALILSGQPKKKSFFLKADLAAGGAGVILLSGQDHGSVKSAMDRLETSSLSTGKQAPWPHFFLQPWLLEVAVGDVSTNRSLTADFYVQQGMVSMAGVADQILAKGVQYQGVQYRPKAFPLALRERVVRVGKAVGQRMAENGFSGWFNLDFILTQENVLHVIEINVRRSAPLDVFLVMRRIRGDDWFETSAFVGYDRKKISNMKKKFVHHLLDGRLVQQQGIGIFPLSNVHTDDQGHRFCSMLSVTGAYGNPEKFA